jgi:nucleotide-binding universal stress UspA family protein
MYDTILYPTDGSEGAAAALTHAQDHAEQYSAALHVLFVADTAYERAGVVGTERGSETTDMVGAEHDTERTEMVGGDDPIRALESNGEAIVTDVAERMSDEVSVTTAVRKGNPYETILGYAETIDADLLVMGTHGRTGLDRYLLGSVTEKVVRTADVPVLTVRLAET